MAEGNIDYRPTKTKVKSWLEGIESYFLHREVKHKFQQNKIEVPGIDVQWDANLTDMTNVSKHNNGAKYILVCIDIFLLVLASSTHYSACNIFSAA